MPAVVCVCITQCAPGIAVVDGGVHREAGRVDRPVGVTDDVAGEVDLDQVRRADLAVVQAERIDQEVRVFAQAAAA